ncbi:uncharacterized protein METZ01_LOCUS335209, partial [marine metagenome]
GPAGHQRCRQVDHPPNHQWPGYSPARGGPTARPDDHLLVAPASIPSRHPAAAWWEGRVRRHDGAPEPRHGRLRAPFRQSRRGTPYRRRARPVPRPGQPSGPTSGFHVGGTTADAGPGPGAPPRTRGAAHRRTVPRSGANRGPRPSRADRTAPRAGPDHRGSGTVAERGSSHRRSGHLPRKRPDPVRGSCFRIGRAGRPGPGRLPWQRRRL